MACSIRFANEGHLLDSTQMLFVFEEVQAVAIARSLQSWRVELLQREVVNGEQIHPTFGQSSMKPKPTSRSLIWRRSNPGGERVAEFPHVGSVLVAQGIEMQSLPSRRPVSPCGMVPVKEVVVNEAW